MRLAKITCLGGLLAVAWLAAADTDCSKLLRGSAEAIVAAGASEYAIDMALKDLNLTAVCSVQAVADAELDRRIRLLIENRRIDKQVGAGSASSGSTSLVASGSVPALLGLALENGAMTQSVSGTSVTFRLSPAKLIAAMAKSYGTGGKDAAEPALRALQRVSVAATFDTGRTAAAESPGGAGLQLGYQQLSEFSARLEILNDRDVFSNAGFKRIRELRASVDARQYANAMRELGYAVTTTVSFNQRVTAAHQRMLGQKLSVDQVADELERFFDETGQAIAASAANRALLDAAVRRWADFKAAQDKAYRDIAKSRILTLEYSLVRPPVPKTTPPTAAPDLSTARLIFADRFIGASEYTVTASANLFNSLKPGMRGNFRDVQLGGKLDIPLPELPEIGKGQLTFAALYAHLRQRPLGIDLKINDQKVNQPGNIGLFQAKYTLPVGDSGVRIPISLTVSNRTELIREKEVRGNIGLTFDLDKLFAKK